jgi:putative membrane protein
MQRSRRCGMHWGCGWGYGPHMWFGGGVFMVFIWIVVVIALVYFIRHMSKNSAGFRSADESPVDILKRRYARGEITKEQYDRMRQDLKD